MKKIRPLKFLAMTLLFYPVLLFSQSPVTIVFGGQLSDMDEVILANKEGMMEFSIINGEEKQIGEYSSTFTTNELGKFMVSFNELGTIFNEMKTAEIANFLITLKPAEGEDWLPDEKFTVKYHLQKIAPDDYKMTRYEGQVLNYSYRMPVWLFTDLYPLAYLKSTFMISFSEDISDAKEIIGICEEMSEGHDMKKSEDEVAPNRGVKGGFAVGGYKAKKK